MDSATLPTPAIPSPTTNCRWTRGRPVPARYSGATLMATNSNTLMRKAGQPAQAGTHAMGAYAHSRCASTTSRPGPKDNRIMDESIARALQQMHLDNGSRATRFTPTAPMHAQHATATVTSSEPPTQASDGLASHTAAPKNGEAHHMQYKAVGIEEKAGHEADVEDAPRSQPDINNMQSSNDFDDSASQQSSVVDAHSEQEEGNQIQTKEEAEEEVEEHKKLDYQIPEDVLRAAMLASPNTRASFWSAKLYRGPNGESLSTHYCRSLEVAERVAKKFLGEKVVGFDIEWRPFSPVKNIKQNASLIQLACEDRIGLFHVALFEGITPSELMPPSLKAILESPDILKVGVAVKGDFSRIQKYLDIQAQGVFELSRLHNLVELHATDPDKISNKLVGLAAQVLQHLQLPLYKGAPLLDDPEDTENVRESDWSKPLNLQQIHYAAADAYAGFRLYHMLEWKRKQLRPTPPIRGLCDYDAKAAPRSTVAKKKKTASKSKDAPVAAAEESEPAIEQDQDEAEEDDGYETAPEEFMDSHDLEDPVAVSPAGVAANAGGNGGTQRRVGRVNLAWLRGPDPGYPTLPQQQVDSNEHGEVDEFADPELEAALQILDVDADGKLTEVANPTADTALNARSSTSILAHDFSSPTQGAAHENLDRGRGPTIPKSEADNRDVEMDHPSPVTSKAQKSTTALPPAFEPRCFTSDETSHSLEYNLATTWAREYLQFTIPSPTSTAPRRIRATVPHLRAYHLWRHQNLPLDEVASHLRDPPLSHSTVSGYILQAVSLERLEYDKDTMRDLMLDMPTALRKGRWKWMAEKVGALR